MWRLPGNVSYAFTESWLQAAPFPPGMPPVLTLRGPEASRHNYLKTSAVCQLGNAIEPDADVTSARG